MIKKTISEIEQIIQNCPIQKGDRFRYSPTGTNYLVVGLCWGGGELKEEIIVNCCREGFSHVTIAYTLTEFGMGTFTRLPTTERSPEVITKEQQQRLFALKRQSANSNEDAIAIIKSYGYQKSTEIQQQDFEAIENEFILAIARAWLNSDFATTWGLLQLDNSVSPQDVKDEYKTLGDLKGDARKIAWFKHVEKWRENLKLLTTKISAK